MSSITNNTEPDGDHQLSDNTSSTADQGASGPAAEMGSRTEVVEDLDLVPVRPGSVWLKHNTVNEYIQLCNAKYTGHTEIDCGLRAILKTHGDPLALSLGLCDCDDEQDHTCWLDPKFCGRSARPKLVYALQDAVYALENGLLKMYHSSDVYGDDPQSYERKPGQLTPGLHRVATMRLTSLTNGVKRLQDYHKGGVDTSPDKRKPASGAGNGGTAQEGSKDSNADGGDEDLAALERRLLACKTELAKPLCGVPDTKASIIQTSRDLDLAVCNSDEAPKGPRAIVRECYEKCVLMVADAYPSLEHYGGHPICISLYCDVQAIDGLYRKARDDLRDYSCGPDDGDEMDDGLAAILRSIWDETRSTFERSVDVTFPQGDPMHRPSDLERDSDDDAWYSEEDGDSQENTDEEAEDV